MTQNMPAPAENQNARKPDSDRASSFLYVRCKPRDKAAWVRAAGQRGLSEWVVDALNRASGESPKKPQHPPGG